MASRIAIAIALLASLVVAAPAQDLEKDKAQLAKLEREYKSAKSAYAKNPKNAKAKSTLVEATVKLGTATMTSAALAPKDKYPRALSLYREALVLDPKNKEALNNKAMIENIYRQMGRPIPK